MTEKAKIQTKECNLWTVSNKNLEKELLGIFSFENPKTKEEIFAIAHTKKLLVLTDIIPASPSTPPISEKTYIDITISLAKQEPLESDKAIFGPWVDVLTSDTSIAKLTDAHGRKLNSAEIKTKEGVIFKQLWSVGDKSYPKEDERVFKLLSKMNVIIEKSLFDIDKTPH